MRAGPKLAVDDSALPFRSPKSGAERFAAFCAQFIVVPKGHGVRRRLRPRPWQVELVASVWDVEPRPRLAGWMLPRGQGKTTLTAALALYDLLLGQEGAAVVVAATDERQAALCLNAARRMVELHPDLEARIQVFQDHLYVPVRGASFQVLPAVPKRLEGLDFTLAILDEAGRMEREVYEVIMAATGKRHSSLALAIGTPPPNPHDSVLSRMREYAQDHPEDELFVWHEFSAAGFTDHPVDCRHCWELANPALGDFLAEDGLVACLPPKLREASFRRARLCQLVDEEDDAWLPPGAWAACAAPGGIPEGSEVVLGVDGSYNADATAIVAATTGQNPHIDLIGFWEAPERARDWLVPILDVEAAIRQACQRFRVREIVFDPFRWARTMQVLEGEGLPVVKYPQSPERMTPATSRFYEAVVNRTLTHSGDPRLARAVANCVLRIDARGARVVKEHKHSRRRIDAAVASLMAFDRAATQVVDLAANIW